MVRRPLLPFFTCSHSSWLFPPQRMLENTASCLDPVVAVSVLAPGMLFMQVHSLCGPGQALHVCDVSLWKAQSSLLVMGG